ncbi:MAG: hypothetical protein O7C75_21035, partial [Verrucomicrobia bacterium]|nr:hypothetical protein [Verrucomicrobiota bacterium]
PEYSKALFAVSVAVSIPLGLCIWGTGTPIRQACPIVGYVSQDRWGGKDDPFYIGLLFCRNPE